MPSEGPTAADSVRARLRVHAWMLGVRDVLGPGNRAVVWVKGCTLRCPGCMVPETWAPEGGQLVDPVTLAQEILSTSGVDGLTVSGGEPTEQAGPVADLVSEFRRAGKDAWVYSGYTLEELVARDDPETDRLLSLVDVLVDGRFVKSLAGSHAYRGSGNQRLLRLSSGGLKPPEQEATGANQFQITLDTQGHLVLVGTPPPGFTARLRLALYQRGVRLSSQLEKQ